MARLARPTRELIAAMEELGLDGWLPGSGRSKRIRITVHNDEVQPKNAPANSETRAASVTERSSTDLPIATTEIVRTAGLVLLAATAGAWIAKIARPESSTSLVRAVEWIDALKERRERSQRWMEQKRIWIRGAVMVGVVLCGVGALAAAGAIAVARRKR